MRRALRHALGIGAVIAVLVPLVFIVGVAGGQTDEPLWLYPALAFVVFATTSMLAAAVLVARRALRLAVHPAAIVRRAATVGTLAGVLWLAGAGALVLGPSQPWASLADVTLPWAALLTPLGCWALYTRHKRTARLPLAFGAGTLPVLVGALVLADLLAFDLVGLLPDVGSGADAAVAGLVEVAASLLVLGLALMAALAALGTEDGTPLVRVVPGLLGLAIFGLFAPGRLALVALVSGFGLTWLAICLPLRHIDEGDVPTGPDPWPVED